MKRELTIDVVFEIEPYRSILNLLIRFQKHGENEGLKQSHFRYALMHNHGNLNPYLKEKMKRFFIGIEGLNRKDYLEPFYKAGYIIPDCITSRSNLSNKLKKLEELGVIYKDQRGKKDRYKINRECRLRGMKITHLKEIDKYSNLFAYKDNGIIYGLSTNMFYKFNEADRSKILGNLEVIDSKLKEIMDIKFRCMFEEWIKILDSKDIKDVIQFTKDIFDKLMGGNEDFDELESKFIELLRRYEFLLGIAFTWSSQKHINPLEELNTTSI